jgi:hypothetical protein
MHQQGWKYGQRDTYIILHYTIERYTVLSERVVNEATLQICLNLKRHSEFAKVHSKREMRSVKL